MNNTSLKSILKVAKDHGYKAEFKLRHISEKMDKSVVKLGDIFEANNNKFGEMIHQKTGEIYNLKGSYVSFSEFKPELEHVELPVEESVEEDADSIVDLIESNGLS